MVVDERLPGPASTAATLTDGPIVGPADALGLGTATGTPVAPGRDGVM